ncbi:hypothetical protein TNCV_1508481 [Trichonephila clavipes]|nr:hypothetical protein TNCV_1508481 [Trichonephila clavipes]
MFEQQDPHLLQVESPKQDSSDVSIKSNQGLINRGSQGAGPPCLTHRAPNVAFRIVVRYVRNSFEIGTLLNANADI